MDILKRATQQAIVETLKPNGQHIGEMFFPMVEELTEESIWDVVNPSSGMADFRAVDGEARIMGFDKFDRKAQSVADMAAKIRLNRSDVQFIREAGELPIVGAGTMAQRAAAKATRKITTELARMREVVDNRLEWARISALQGDLEYTDTATGITIDLDYGFTAEQKGVTPSVNWNIIATSNPVNDLQTWMDTVADATGVVPTTIITSRKALSYAAQSTALRGYFQYTDPILTAQDVTRLLNDRLGVNVITYEARYTASNGTWTRFLAENKLIMLPDMGQMRGATRFADTAYVPHPHNNYQGSYYVWNRETTDPWGIEVGAGLTALPRIYTPSVVLTADLW